MRFALPERIQGISRQARRIADLGISAGAGGAEANCDVSLPVHRRTSHPAPDRIGSIRAFLVNGDWSSSDIT